MLSDSMEMRPKFALGEVLASQRVLEIIPRKFILDALEQHVAGKSNLDLSVRSTDIISSFHWNSSREFIIRTDAQRSTTFIALAEEMSYVK